MAKAAYDDSRADQYGASELPSTSTKKPKVKARLSGKVSDSSRMSKTSRKKSSKPSKNRGGKVSDDKFKEMVDDESDDPKSTIKRTEDAKTWHERFDLAYRNEKNMKKKWAEWYEMMYAIKNYQDISPWKSQIFIPVISYKAWTIIAKLLALRPGFSVRMYDELYSDEDRKAIEKANLKLEYDYDNPMLEESIRDKEFDIFTDATVCGTGFGKAEWISGQRTYYEHFQKDDGTIDYSKAVKTDVDYGYNDLDPLNAFDVFGAPGGRSWEAKPYHIARYRKTRAQLLESDMYDEKAVNDLKPIGKQRDEITKYKQSRNQFIGATQDDQESIDDTVDSFTIYECYEKTPDGVFLITFAEAGHTSDAKDTSKNSGNGSWYEIRNERQPYWHRKYPIQPAYIRRRPHDCWGESIFEVTESMATGYNDLVNQLADNIAIVGNGGILMHETSTTIYDFYYAPGGEVRYSGTKPTFETPDSPDLQMFSTMFNLMEQGVTNATVSPYATGTPSDSNDQTRGTMGGINALQEAAGEITAFMKTSIMQFVKGIGIRWLSNNRQFLDDAVSIQQKRHGKTQVYRITSQDFAPNMVLTIDEDSMQPTTPDQKRQDTTAWITSLSTIQDRSMMQAGLIPNPAVPAQMDPATGQPAAPAPVEGVKPIYIDWQKVAAEMSEDYGKPDIDEFLLDPTTPDDDTTNTDIIAGVRKLVKDGAIEGEEGQAIIDGIENRKSTVTPKISQEGDNDTPAAAEQFNDQAAGDASAALSALTGAAQ